MSWKHGKIKKHKIEIADLNNEKAKLVIYIKLLEEEIENLKGSVSALSHSNDILHGEIERLKARNLANLMKVGNAPPHLPN